MKFPKKLTLIVAMVTMVGATVSTACAAQDIDLSSDKARLGYSFGVQIAENMISSNLQDEVSVEAIEAALNDVFSGKDLRMSPKEMQDTQERFQQRMQVSYTKMLQENADKSAAFMAENGKKNGIVTTESGLQYEVIREGKGKQPTTNDTVKVHYEGKLVDGTKFDSSYDRGAPADFPVTGVIPGFSEGLLAMKEGAKYTLYIPASQAYGENGPPSIGPNQALVFEVELIEVMSQEP